MEEQIKRNHKIRMPYRLKGFLLGLGAVTFIALLAFLLMSYLAPRTEEQELTNYKYHHKGELTYEVALRDNLLYENKVVGMNKVYPSNFVEQITAFFKYEFTGDKKAALSGQYQVVATVQGIQTEEQEEKVIWSKEFILEPETPFAAQVMENGPFHLQKELRIPFGDFNSFAQQVQQDTGILSNVVLTVKYLLKTRAETEYGAVNEELAPTLRLPLCMAHFEVAGELSQEKEGALTERVIRTVPVNPTLLSAVLLGMGLCLLLLLGLVFLVRGTRADPYQKRLKEIFKKYGERLVALEQELSVDPDGDDRNAAGQSTCIRVKHMDDLVRIADEISQPVYFLEPGPNEEKGHEFYVISDQKIFFYEIKRAISTEPSPREKQEINYEAPVKAGTEELGA
jgi:hypothetical protein